MPIDATVIVAIITGIFGVAAASAIGSRFTQNARFLAVGGVLAGLAVGLFAYVLSNWMTRGFNPAHTWLLPLAALVLLLVMAVQNWFVFYQDRRDVAESTRPVLVLACAAVASMLAAFAAGRHPWYLPHAWYFPLIWASAGSWAILLSLPPIQRSIDVNRSVPIGIFVGICKILLPFGGVLVFLPTKLAERTAREIDERAFWNNLIGLLCEIGLLLPAAFINGARVTPAPTRHDPLEYLLQAKDEPSVAGETPRLKRDSVVWILVLAIHVLCGVVIIKA
jgi:hypothetical protein